MLISFTSDFHGRLPDITPVDFLFITGDLCPVSDHSYFWQRNWLEHDFHNWLKEIPAKHIVGIAGNHDFIAQTPDGDKILRSLPWIYLNDEFVVIDGIKIHGSPWTPNFFDWAFMKEDIELAENWNKIPDDTQILLTHGPPHGILDWSDYGAGTHTGSQTLLQKVASLEDLRFHAFGHIHPEYGAVRFRGVHYVNGCYVNSKYKAQNKPIIYQGKFPHMIRNY